MSIKTDDLSQKMGLPTFNMQVTGIADTSAYFLMDFSSDYSVFWNTNCQTTGIGSFLPGSCSAAPTLLSTEFDPINNNSTGIIHKTGIFENAPFGGYIVSGTQYETKVCLNVGACKFVNIYSGELVS